MVPPKKKIAWMQNFADIESIKSKILIYPTDTVYGIGCNAENIVLVERLYAIKGRDEKKPFSVIAPGKNWILDNCVVSKETIDKYLPGKYTLILKKKDKKFLEIISRGATLGVRIPANRFSRLVEQAKVPFVTTSANPSGARPPKSLAEMHGEIKDAADIVIDSGILPGIPSTLVDCTGKKEIIIERA